MKIIDLYSGIGGASLGFKNAGFEPAFGCEIDRYAQLIYATNFQLDSRYNVDDVVCRQMPHPEILFAAPPARDMAGVARILKEIQPRCVMFEFPARMVNKAELEKRPQFDFMGYKCWNLVLNVKDYGLPQDREVCCMVGFRRDVKTLFSAFPFPEPTCQGKTLESILEAAPDPKLTLTEKQLIALKKRNEKNEAGGTGFRMKILTPSDIAPAIPVKYYKDYRGIAVDCGAGPRRLSVLECRRLMGFHDEFQMPVSDTCAYRLLAQASCPVLVSVIAAEIKDWIGY